MKCAVRHLGPYFMHRHLEGLSRSLCHVVGRCFVSMQFAKYRIKVGVIGGISHMQPDS